jgi:hypothetical protein
MQCIFNEVRKAWEGYTAKSLDYRNADGVVLVI